MLIRMLLVIEIVQHSDGCPFLFVFAEFLRVPAQRGFNREAVAAQRIAFHIVGEKVVGLRAGLHFSTSFSSSQNAHCSLLIFPLSEVCPSRVISVSSFSLEPKPISGREISLTAIAHSPFRFIFSHAVSVFGPGSAAKPITFAFGLATLDASAMMSGFSTSSSICGVFSRRIFVSDGWAGRK